MKLCKNLTSFLKENNENRVAISQVSCHPFSFADSVFDRESHFIGQTPETVTEDTEMKQTPKPQRQFSKLIFIHYYYFREPGWKHRIVKNADGQWINKEDFVFIPVYNRSHVSDRDYLQFLNFNLSYNENLNSLQKERKISDSNRLIDKAVRLILALQNETRSLLQIPINQSRPAESNLGQNLLLNLRVWQSLSENDR